MPKAGRIDTETSQLIVEGTPGDAQLLRREADIAVAAVEGIDDGLAFKLAKCRHAFRGGLGG